MNVDLYNLLGVKPSADAATIKAAYRRLAMKYHPDQNLGDKEAEEYFKKITQAYEVLSDPQRRRAYDRMRRRSPAGQSQGWENLSEFFDAINSAIATGLGGLGRRDVQETGKNIRTQVRISMEEAFTGLRRDISVPRPRGCSRCGGSGAEPGTGMTTCGECSGRGQIRVQQGFFSLMKTCPKCGGRGRLVQTPCRRCSGVGTIEGTELVSVAIPAGVRDGQTLRMAEKGAPGPVDRPPGDLLVDIQVENHPRFRRDGQDVYVEVPVTFTQASLGAKVEVPTLDGRVRMTIPAGSQSGRRFRLAGKGFPAIGGRPRGDQYVRLKVGGVSTQSRSGGTTNSRRGRRGGLWSRVRDLFDS